MKPVSSDKNRSLNILLVSSEMYPYAKAGGLADVVSSLAAELRHQGHDARIVIPRYGMINLEKIRITFTLAPMGVWMGNREEWCSVYGSYSDDGVPVYFIEHELYFNRWGLYHDASMKDYEDNPMRFGFLSRAALQLCKDINFKPDIVHANDWQTALCPAYLKIWHWNDPILGGAASVLTLHNIAYQGIYPKSNLDYLGLGWHNFTPEKFETYDRINFLKGGIHYADKITAVSPSFAHEIVQPNSGFGLAPYLSDRNDDLTGILNGVDCKVWDPMHDSHLPAAYSSNDLSGKKVCKRHLQKTFDLVEDESVAIIGTIGRFVDQKGYHLIAQAIERILGNMHVQFVILGAGERNYEEFFGSLPVRYSGRVGSYIGFNNYRAHLIEAGCDFFLMPSLFEPCGLNQMYSQRYGTLPVVRATGGLNDTVKNYNEADGTGTGFKFWDATADALYYTTGWAVSTFYDRPSHINSMIKEAMAEDFSWERSAEKYIRIYQSAIETKRLRDSAYRPYYW
jgi:starch synthase